MLSDHSKQFSDPLAEFASPYRGYVGALRVPIDLPRRQPLMLSQLSVPGPTRHTTQASRYIMFEESGLRNHSQYGLWDPTP